MGSGAPIMDVMDHPCPDCGTEMSVTNEHGTRKLACPTCRGTVLGLSPFEKLLADGVGAQVWTGSASGAPVGACPYCTQPMHRPDGDPDAGAGLAVCRTCQQVWVPPTARDWMDSHTAHPLAPPPAAVPTGCANCGAPFQPDEEGRCQFCRAQIAAPQPMVMIVQPAPSATDWGLRL